MRFLLLFGFLHLIDAQQNSAQQSYPANWIPPNLGLINKVIDVTFTHNLPNLPNFVLREEDEYTWSYFTTGLGFQFIIRQIIWLMLYDSYYMSHKLWPIIYVLNGSYSIVNIRGGAVWGERFTCWHMRHMPRNEKARAFSKQKWIRKCPYFLISKLFQMPWIPLSQTFALTFGPPPV